MGVPVTVVVPTTTGIRMQRLIADTGAEVQVRGSVWDEAHEAALRVARSTGGAVLHPFDHPDIWEGHASLISEVSAAGVVPSSVVVAVGGGGLLCGILQGMIREGWTDTQVLAVETSGAASFAAAQKAGQPVDLAGITSVALTLGARRVCERVVELSKSFDVRSVVVSDAAAVEACSRFLDHHRTLVEPSCGAALSTIYDRHPLVSSTIGPVLVVVCGGAAVTPKQLDHWLVEYPRG
jgi:L-serine/L-threonine ammonia-lyase